MNKKTYKNHFNNKRFHTEILYKTNDEPIIIDNLQYLGACSTYTEPINIKRNDSSRSELEVRK